MVLDGWKSLPGRSRVDRPLRRVLLPTRVTTAGFRHDPEAREQLTALTRMIVESPAL